MTYTVIAIGGTGARCAEAIAHLGATGAFREKLRFLLIDLDQSNGNLDRTREIITRYRELHGHASEGRMFRDKMELQVWKAPEAAMTFGEALQWSSVSEGGQRFLRLFYSSEYEELDLSKGCYQHPEIGSLILRRLLRASLSDEESGLRRTVNALAEELQHGQPTRIFVVGSVFGGTGASGLPFMPAFLASDELASVRPEFATRQTQLCLGAAFVGPYFQWRGEGNKGENGPQVNRLISHARSILQHYSRHLPKYERIYLLGAPQLHVTCDSAAEGGNQQLHRAHYVEWTTALAALDFFTSSEHRSGVCSYVESTVKSGDGESRRQLGINWGTLPVEGKSEKDRVRSGFLELTILTSFLRGHLLPGLHNGRFEGYPWYEEGVQRSLPADDRRIIEDACDEYLRWLTEVLRSVPSGNGSSDHPSLLALGPDQLKAIDPNTDLGASAALLPSLLMIGEAEEDYYHQICTAMDRISPTDLMGSDARRSPLGRLLFFASPAVQGLVQANLAQVGVVQPGVVRDHDSSVQSRYLPRLEWEPEVFAHAGEFTHGGRELLAKIGDGLKVGDGDAALFNPISSPWARAYLFETKLLSDKTGRSRTVAQWRGLLGILAFRRLLGDGQAVQATGIDLAETASSRSNASALEEFVREASAEGKKEWLQFHVLELRGQPVAGISPFTFLFPAADIAQVMRNVSMRMRHFLLGISTESVVAPAPSLSTRARRQVSRLVRRRLRGVSPRSRYRLGQCWWW